MPVIFAVAFPVFVSMAANAAATSEPDPLISIALLTVIFPVIALLIVVISVAVISVVLASVISTVPVLVVTVPAKAALISDTVPLRFAVGVFIVIVPSVPEFIAFNSAIV